MAIFSKLINRFTSTSNVCFLKRDSNLSRQQLALEQLLREEPNNDYLKRMFFIVKKSLAGEQEIEYQLSKSSIGAFVLHDVNLEFNGLTAQIDYVVVTKAYMYFIECKNLYGDITVDEKGEFIRSYTWNGKKVKKAMYSPLRQVEAQREVYRKIWEAKKNTSTFGKIQKFLAKNNFNNYNRVLVVVANSKSILNTRRAPRDIKYKILRADGLVRQLEYDIKHSDRDLWDSTSAMRHQAEAILSLNVDKNTDYYEFFKQKLANN